MLICAVQQARKIKTCKIVSYDWLEDSLVKFTCKRAGPYLLSAQFKASEKTKAKKKEVRDTNIKKGGLPPPVSLSPGLHVLTSPSEDLRAGLR